MIKLRPYQENVLVAVNEQFKTGNDMVVAASPSSGKTTMMLEFIKRTPGKFLILTHGQDIIRQMWATEISNFLTPDEQSRVTYNLPQTLSRKEVPLVDFVIIDEAHQFTFADMVQKILNVNKNAKKIYLTGTPSKFIARKYPIKIVPALDLIEQGYISDLYIGLFSTTAHLNTEDRNSDGNLKSAGAAKLARTVNSDLDALMEALLKRLKASVTKSNPNAARLLSDVPSLGSLGQTMIACASTDQASKVLKYLKQKGINALSSNSKSDPTGENILKFQNDSKVKVLVVVDRGVLGFNMPQLENVVDMTCSTNIDRIYQLYARVMRKDSNVKKKYFFKLAPVEEMQVMKFYTQASLCLMHESFISRFNGKNLDEMEIPVKIVPKVKKPKRERSNVACEAPRSLKEISFDEFFMEQVSATKLLTDVYNKMDQPLNEFAMVKIGEIRRECFGEFVREFWDLEKCIQSSSPHNTKSEWRKNCPQAYQAAKRNKWIDLCCGHMSNKYSSWSLERCLAESARFSRKIDWMKGSRNSYAAALAHGWTQQCSIHMQTRELPTLERCKATAAGYQQVQDWLKASPSTYYSARKHGWLEECYSHMKRRRKWDLDLCKQDALKFQNKTAWRNSSSGYAIAFRRGWLDECCAHMKGLK